jgi:hypothetical protein
MRRILTVLAFLIAALFTTSALAQDDKGKDDDSESPDNKADDSKDAKKDEEGGKTTMKIGVKLTSLNKLDLAADTFAAEMIVTVHCDREPCAPAFEINGKITGTDKLKDDPKLKVYKMRAELEAAIDTSEFPFDDHMLPIVLSDKSSPESVVYEKDDEHTSIGEKVKLPGWELTGAHADVLTLEDGSGGSVSQYWLAVQASRPRIQGIFKTVLPLLVMLFVAAFMLMLKPKSAPARLTAATGGLTAIVMFHVGQATGLPPGELTRFDKFMFTRYAA